MTNNFKSNCFDDPKARFTLWPIVVTIAALIWVCLGLNHFAASRDMPNLYCESELYFQPESLHVASPFSRHSSDVVKLLTLELSHRGELVFLVFKYVEDNKLVGSITLDGQLLGLEIASMTYKLLLDKHDVELTIDESELPKEIQRLIANEHNTGRKPKHLPIDIQMLELSPETGHGILQLKPSNNLWNCQISA